MTGASTGGNYRPDIQGLRALAVLLVFFSHAGWPFFGGGFIGVDVFFVISGYVISAYLLREYTERGSIRLLSFYARRLQRLMPALLVMVLVVCGLAMLLMVPEERSRHLDAASNALLWISNLFFYFSDIDYFGGAVDENLFLHTWTLGVEEQFYLLWPLMLLAGLSGAWRWALPALLGLVAAMSLWLCLYWADNNPNAAFYLVPSRGWQFAIGGLVAWWHHGGRGRLPDAAANLASCVGIAAVVATGLMLDEHSAYPRLNALAPTLGTALVLAGSGWCNRLLATRPAVWLGDISYGFYLWHWPVLLFFEDLQPFYPALNSGLALLLTTGLAAASFYLLEQPLRTSRALLARPRPVLGGAVVGMALAILLLSSLVADYQWIEPEEIAGIERAAAAMPRPYLDGCDDWYHSDSLSPCSYGKPGAEQIAVLMGDSIALQWFSALNAVYRERGWQLVVLTKSACPMVDRPYYYARIRSEYDVCDRWREQAVTYVAELEPDQLIIGSSGDYPFSLEDWRQGTGEVLVRLAPHAADVILLAPTPGLDVDGPDCLVRGARLAQLLPIAPAGGCTSAYSRRPQLASLEAAAQGHANVRWVDFSEYVCPGDICRARLESHIAFRDHDHLTEQFVMSLRGRVEARLMTAPAQ